MVDNHQRVLKHMGQAIKAAYGIEDPLATHGGPFSYATYLRKLLEKRFWGDEIVLWSISMMWQLKITVSNSKSLQEYRIWHDCSLRHVDVALVYNSHTHYSAAGESSDWSLAIFPVCIKLVTCIGHNSTCKIIGHQATWSLALYLISCSGHLHNTILVTCCYSPAAGAGEGC